MAKAQDLNDMQPVVDSATGRPTLYFMRMLRDRGVLANTTEDRVTVNEADIVTLRDTKADKTTQMIAGTGLSGGGDLSADRTFTLSASIDNLTDVDTVTVPPTNGQALVWNSGSSLWKPATITSSGGTVTSVAATVPTGFSVTGSPITTSGTLAITFAAGYSLPLTTSQTNWNTAFGWGNHATAGYLTSVNLTTNVTNILPIANGGTNASTVPAARSNLLPAYTANAGKVLAVNVGETDVEWVTPASGGGSTLAIDGGTASNTGTAYIAIEGGSA